MGQPGPVMGGSLTAVVTKGSDGVCFLSVFPYVCEQWYTGAYNLIIRGFTLISLTIL